MAVGKKLDFQLCPASRTVEFPQYYPVAVKGTRAHIDFPVFRVSFINQGIKLPVLFMVAKLMATGTLNDALMAFLHNIEMLLKRHEGETFAVISHGVTIRIIYAVLTGLSAEEVSSKNYEFLCSLFFKKAGDKIELEKAWGID